MSGAPPVPVLWGSWARLIYLSIKRQCPSVSEWILMGVTDSSAPSASHTALSARVSWGGDPAPGPSPPRLRVQRQFNLPDLSPMPGHPHGATRQTHAPLCNHWRSAGGGSASHHPGEDSHLGEAPGGVGGRRVCHWCWEDHGSASITLRWTGAEDSLRGGATSATLPASSQPPERGQPPPLQPTPPRTYRQCARSTTT